MAQAKDLPHSLPLDEDGFRVAFAKHVDAGDQVLAVMISGKLSKCYENAKAAATKFGDKVRVVDTAALSGGQFLLAMIAAEMAKSGAPIADIVSTLERGKRSTFGYMVMPTMEYLGRSGRVNKALVALGSIMKVNPILQVRDGLVESAGQTRTYDKAKELIVDIVARNVSNPAATRIAVGHTHAPELADQVGQALKTKLGNPLKTFVTYEVGPSVAVNCGPGAVGIFGVSGI
jgi:DegV family protein with EDD domain